MTVGRPVILLPVTVVACLAGLAAGMQPFAALLAVSGLIVAIVSIVNVTAAVAAFSALAVAYFGATPTKAFAAGLLVALAWWIATTGDRTGRRSMFAAHPRFTWLVLGFLAWMALSVAWAHDRSVALPALARYALVLFFFPAVFAAAQTRRDALVVIGTIVLAAAGSTLFELVSGPSSGPRFGGPTADPNTFAAVLLPAAILGAAMGMRRVGLPRGWRLTMRTAAALAFGGVIASQSRGALIAAIVVIVALPLVAGRWRRGALVLSLSVLAAAGASFAIQGSPLVKTFQSRGFGTSGRSDLWTIATRMIEANPAAGVGVGNFRASSVDYLLRPGRIRRSQYVVDTPLVAHNSFLQVAAETGLIGVALFIGIIAACLVAAWQAARRFERLGDPGFELIARALILAIVAMLTTQLFLTYTDYGRPFWLLLALAPAVLAASNTGSPYRPLRDGRRTTPDVPELL